MQIEINKSIKLSKTGIRKLSNPNWGKESDSTTNPMYVHFMEAQYTNNFNNMSFTFDTRGGPPGYHRIG